MPPHPLTNVEIQKHYQNEPKFNGVYSRNNLPKIKDGTYVINLDEFKLIQEIRKKEIRKKSGNSLEIKMLKQIIIECKHMIQ